MPDKKPRSPSSMLIGNILSLLMVSTIGACFGMLLAGLMWYILGMPNESFVDTLEGGMWGGALLSVISAAIIIDKSPPPNA